MPLDILCINRSVASVEGDALTAEAPWSMADWDAQTAGDITDVCDWEQSWNSFGNHFETQSGQGDELATFENGGYGDNTGYFSCSCVPHAPVGGTGGATFRIRAPIPAPVS